MQVFSLWTLSLLGHFFNSLPSAINLAVNAGALRCIWELVALEHVLHLWTRDESEVMAVTARLVCIKELAFSDHLAWDIDNNPASLVVRVFELILEMCHCELSASQWCLGWITASTHLCKWCCTQACQLWLENGIGLLHCKHEKEWVASSSRWSSCIVSVSLLQSLMLLDLRHAHVTVMRVCTAIAFSTLCLHKSVWFRKPIKPYKPFCIHSHPKQSLEKPCISKSFGCNLRLYVLLHLLFMVW